ncbi:MAG: putative acylesterase/phospholipase RssA [Candidatus Endobugula sp.]|jgi:NTE family protein
MIMIKKKKITALVLQGGGALGAYEYGVVKALYEQEDFSPDIICGVSIGAFSAAVIAGSKTGPVDGLKRLWKSFTSSNMPLIPHPLQVLMTLPYNAGMYKPSLSGYMNPIGSTHFCDTRPLYKTLEEIIDFEKLNSADAPHVVISATNIATGLLEEFSNKTTGIRVEHIVASGSLPPSFPMTKIDDGYYWDGGLFSNTPLKPAFKCLENTGDDDCEKEVIMVELFPQKGKVPHHMPGVFDRMIEMTFQSKMSFDKKMYERISDYIDFISELNEILPKDSHLRNSPAFKQLMSYSKISKLTMIQRSEPENLLGASDFTEKTINQRIEQGYHDTKKQLSL